MKKNLDTARQQKIAFGVFPGKVARPFPAARILVIDDDPVVRDCLTLILSEAGYLVECAVDGEDGLRRFLEDRGFDAVLADWNMPRMNGMNLIAGIRRHDQEVALCLITTHLPQNHFARTKLHLEYTHIFKPFTPRELLEKLEEALNRRRQEAIGHEKIIG